MTAEASRAAAPTPRMLNPKWKEPGDFLYYHPYSDEYFQAADYANDGQHVRNMFELAEDEENCRWRWLRAMFSSCSMCLVAWERAEDGPNCWVCGALGSPSNPTAY